MSADWKGNSGKNEFDLRVSGEHKPSAQGGEDHDYHIVEDSRSGGGTLPIPFFCNVNDRPYVGKKNPSPSFLQFSDYAVRWEEGETRMVPKEAGPRTSCGESGGAVSGGRKKRQMDLSRRIKNGTEDRKSQKAQISLFSTVPTSRRYLRSWPGNKLRQQIHF